MDNQIKLGSMSKVTPGQILTSIINVTPISRLCTCPVNVYNQDLTSIWQIRCSQQMAYCTQKWLKSWTKTIFTNVSGKDPESDIKLFLSFTLISEFSCMCSFDTHAHFSTVFSVQIFIGSHRSFASGIFVMFWSKIN